MIDICVGMCVSISKGLLLGGSLCFIGYLLDNTISYKSQEQIVREKPELFLQAQQAIITNLLLITPITYVLSDYCLLNQKIQNVFYISQYLSILFIHNVGYFLIHREMHRNRYLYNIHKFHHCFDSFVVPSISNAVSISEFLLSFSLPFFVIAWIIRPTGITFFYSIETISIFNMIMHINELDNMTWIPGMVAPSLHIEHHRSKIKHYSSGFFDIDSIFSQFVNR